MLNTITPNKDDFWAKDKQKGWYWHIKEGTGDNLSQEDIDKGYVDYIYYDCYESLQDIHDDNIADGGMYYLRKLYQNHSLEEIIECLQDFEMVTLEVVE